MELAQGVLRRAGSAQEHLVKRCVFSLRQRFYLLGADPVGSCAKAWDDLLARNIEPAYDNGRLQNGDVSRRLRNGICLLGLNDCGAQPKYRRTTEYFFKFHTFLMHHTKQCLASTFTAGDLR